MKFTTKNYKISKIRNYLKENNLFFFFNGVNRNSNDWILTDQSLRTINFSYYKVFNKTTIKTLKNSIFSNSKSAISGTTFFIKPTFYFEPLSRHVILNNFEPLLFIMLAIKFNNKIYRPTQIKNINSLEYKENMLLFYQFGIVHLKSCFNFKN